MFTKDNSHEKYKQYLKEKHTRFGVSSEVVNDIVTNALGVGVDSLKRIVAGEVNEVYDTKTKDGNFIVRISRGEENRFLTEKWALNAARDVGVPTPQMFFIDEFENNGTKLKVCIENKLPGVSFNEIIEQEKLSGDQIKRINEEAGVILAKLHSVAPERFGSFIKGGVGSNKTWTDYVLKNYSDKEIENLYISADKIGLSRHQIDRILIILNDNTKVFGTVTPHLLHCDFGPKHYLVRDGEITGIIDFENCKSGDPVYDFAWLDYFGHDNLQEGYKKIAEIPNDYKLRISLYGLRISLSLISWYVAEKHITGMEHTKKQIEKYLKYFN
ncbi:hypothetical protein A2422_01830 [Candidatus Woesebacteria bacterium RIFOXYC1_FULL_31_51]|uniref:Aminoglycoside phosphotransferase n=1 Tax=Candidatus Woesebacteria bacterium GW2011_GWC2_31_9 TaxID=1618586 RepID=A0A0F9YZR2_9BACT|nr:MAG: aminoglycoside phosphotransferase [Candidatus Woesebacteria bacterium GW2011_GWF1_31_35]KKP23633.1 MAG: Aminoglycoside phosphotransferase [Candidatus Woesebacteria bacterium GW2011_GWC1_30_29]KKP26986.1 MAG: Aminoglycoside phosphotransferase [Candidatus Woesebacteria bacterium GW2011_GWD1_31_12]KKP27908.1 MAG: Aminoglycoside phosphotransferase [Candidatus Woesebacteria bacterium GW2011_GWB1_31_29]KKP31911.1 MAG: Aminoglycoside phosphotransferase [Candidatus Woesebacteria bacterium GW201